MATSDHKGPLPRYLRQTVNALIRSEKGLDPWDRDEDWGKGREEKSQDVLDDWGFWKMGWHFCVAEAQNRERVS